jgi:threonine/homoserine/homoserine lactone efflux protein
LGNKEEIILFATVVSVHLLASMRPGPNFLISAKHGLIYSHKKALVTTAGVATGTLVHVMLGFFGFSAIIAQSFLLYRILKYIGAAYLITVGIVAMFSKKRKITISFKEPEQLGQILSFHAFQIGFFTMLTNIMAAFHFLGLFTTVIPSSTPMIIKVTLIIILPVISWLWFSIVALSFSLKRFRYIYIRFQRWIDAIFGLLMISLGFRIGLETK